MAIACTAAAPTVAADRTVTQDGTPAAGITNKDIRTRGLSDKRAEMLCWVRAAEGPPRTGFEPGDSQPCTGSPRAARRRAHGTTLGHSGRHTGRAHSSRTPPLIAVHAARPAAAGERKGPAQHAHAPRSIRTTTRSRGGRTPAKDRLIALNGHCQVPDIQKRLTRASQSHARGVSKELADDQHTAAQRSIVRWAVTICNGRCGQ